MDRVDKVVLAVVVALAAVAALGLWSSVRSSGEMRAACEGAGGVYVRTLDSRLCLRAERVWER